MSYELACEQMYLEREAAKSKLQKARDKFRQSVLNRQNKIQHTNGCRTKDSSEITADSDFIMPDCLPDNEAQLKWLIFQNLDIMKLPERKKEAQANIKRIKEFINEQKSKQGISAQGVNAP